MNFHSRRSGMLTAMKHVVLLNLCLLCFCVVATAQNDVHVTTGNELREKCRIFFQDLKGNPPTTMTNMERIDMGYCAGYLDGVVDVQRNWNWVEEKSSKASHYCLPDEATKGQMLSVIDNWMNEHPEELHNEADFIIHKAFLKAFPCK